MRRKLFIGLVLLNGLIAGAFFVQPAETQIIPLGNFDCCKEDGGDGYCCFHCCWFIPSCDGPEDCSVM